MPRVLVVGQAGEAGPLPCAEFAEMLSQRLGVPPLPLDGDAGTPEQPDWIASEPAGAFSEPLFRKAETVIWLHFSPLPYLGDWIEHQLERITAFITPRQRAAARARWDDVLTAFGYLLRARDMYSLFRHPALAHVRVIELRTPREAEFWLMAHQRRRKA